MTTKKLLLAIMAMLLPLGVMAENVEIDGICYNLISKGKIAEVIAKKSGYYSSNISIPSSINYQGIDYSVTSIGEAAFRNCSSLTSVTIPNSVTSVRRDTFRGCSNLISVTIPNSVTSIGEAAFRDCSSLTSVTIPNSVTSVGRDTFLGCSSLISVTIPNSVTSIGGGTFYKCSSLTSVVIPNSVITIGDNVFWGCSSLTSVTIPNSVTSIDGGTFCGCSGLTSLTIPNSVTSIGEKSFYNCSGLTSVTIPNSVTTIGSYAFSGCSGLTSLTIPSSVTTIGSSAFSGCSGLTSVTIPNSVTSIGNYAFWNCTGLASIEVASGNTTYDSRDNCNAIIETASNTLLVGCINTIIPQSVTSIGDYAFSRCTGLTSVTIPNSVTSIGSYAFWNCSRLLTIEIGESVYRISSYAFANCENLTDVTCFAKSVPGTDVNAFKDSYIDFATLHVPDVSVNLYKQASPWNTFKEIVPLTIKTYILTYMVDDEVYKTYEMDYGTPITPEPEPTKEGYIFSGWSEIPETMPDHDVTITGSFSPNTYKLTYNVDGEEYKVVEVKYDETITAELEPTRKGMTFSGWGEIPDKMPAKNVTVTGTFGWSKITNNKIIYQVTDTINNYAAVIGNSAASSSVTIAPDIDFDYKYKVTSIADRAFNGCKDVTSIEIPATITNIGERAFAKIDKLTDVTITAEDVPTTDRTSFENSYIEDYVTLHVPAKALEQYKMTAPWSGFKQILSIEGGDTPEPPIGTKCAMPTIAMKDGKLIFSCETPDVEFNYEITANDSKTGKGNNLSLKPSYIVKVYASKEGYENSEVATQAIYLKHGDVNGDGEIDIADAVRIVNHVVGKEIIP